MSDVSVAAPSAVATGARDAQGKSESTPARVWAPIDLVIVVLVGALALVPRTVNLLALDPFIDEAAWVDWALRQFELTSPRSWFIPLLTDGRPPLFVWLIVPVGAIIDNGFLAGRLVAALADVGCVVALYLLGRELASRLAGALAAILWALSPFSIFFARIAADDSLLTLMAVLATLASVHLARQPTLTTGALCGLSLALTVLVKPNGILLAIAPPFAILVLGRPFVWRSYVRPVGAAVVAGLLACVPLLIGIGPLLQQASLHTSSGDGGGVDLLTRNATVAAGWMTSFVGNRFLIVAGMGIVAAIFFRQAGPLYGALLGITLMVVVLEVTATMFARRLLLPAFPAFLLAGYAIERAAHLVIRGLRQIGVAGGRVRLVASLTVVGLGLWVALGERADLAIAMIQDPARAALPGSEHMQYVENWFAVYGLGQVAGELQARSRERPVTVLVPPASREGRVLVPYAALRYYLRREPGVRFVEVPALWRAQDLRELRRFTRDGPTYLVVNGSHTPGSGMPNDVPEYTRRLERRLAQDLPGAREVLRIARPMAPNWLSLYRLDE